MDYEIAADEMARLVIWARDNPGARNEATTRLHLIDRLLIDVLGWPRELVEAERHFRGEYSDYELGGDRKLGLLEAKREGLAFELPIGFDRPECRLRTLADLEGDAFAAVNQAMEYAQSRGIAVAAVANGTQLVVFIASRQDGVPPEDGMCLVFPSLEAMQERFKRVWDALSPAGLVGRGAFYLLDAEHVQPPPPRLSSRIVGYPGYKNRNPQAAELQILGGLFLEDVARIPEYEEEFVRDTYCVSGALSQYALVSREILKTRYSTHFEKEARVTTTPARTKKGVEPELERDLLVAGLSRRPIVLVGDVGVGKSMFILHLIHVDAREALDRAVVLYVDFVKKPAIADDLTAYVAGEIQRQLREKYDIDVTDNLFVRGVHNLRLQQFGSSVFGGLRDIDPDEFGRKEIDFLAELMADREQHLKACLEHIVRGQNRQVVLFLDNIDQRPAHFQEQVFVMGHAFAEDWPLTVFVALRPDTFRESRAAGPLSAYQPRVFTIEPPRVDQVITKRLAYALERLRETGRLPTFPKGLTLKVSSLEQYLEMLSEAMGRGDQLVELIDNLSDGNLRRALDFVATFVGSGHVDTGKIFRILDGTGYTLPRHEFLRALMYGDNEHYDPTTSPVVNLFDVSSVDTREHFLLPSVLGFVERAGSGAGTEGFVRTEQIYAQFQGLGFQVRAIAHAIRNAGSKGLLAGPSFHRDADWETLDRLRITTSGAYSAKRLPGMFEYVDAVIVDTPILIDDYRSLIVEEQSTGGRVSRVRTFAEYLDRCWDPMLLPEIDWRAHARHLRSECDRVDAKHSTV
ncbi:MAG: hypothetical protein AB7N70_19170 [Dehalococcoidia bacterium]